MPTCALVGAIKFNAAHFSSQQFDSVIAVDFGYASLKSIGCVPDLVVGDFDSLGYVPNEGDVLRFPSEKDESDMELAIAAAEKHGCDTLCFYGCLGGRLDHTLANLQLMTGCARRGMRVFGIGRDFVVTVLDGAGQREIVFAPFNPTMLDEESYGRFISVFAYGTSVSGVTETGLKYALEGARLSDDVSLGLSNEFTGRLARISVESGNLLITFPIAAWRYCTSTCETG